MDSLNFELSLDFVESCQYIPKTLKLQSAELPAASVNVYVTSIVPTGNWTPGATERITVGCSFESSVAVGSCHTTLVNWGVGLRLTVLVMSDGQLLITGGVTSPSMLPPPSATEEQ